MKLTRKALALGFAVAAISAAACSSQHGSTVGSGSGGGAGSPGVIGGGQTGSVGMHLNIPNGLTVDSLNWTISNGTNSYTGTINMTDDAGNAAQSIEFVAGPILAGGGYTVTLAGHDSANDPCTGTSPAFAVNAGTSSTAQAVVNIVCTTPTDAALSTDVNTGTVAVDAGITLVNQAPFQCPAITGVSISPAELHPPQHSDVAGGVTGGAGGTPTLLWTATCGTGTPIIGTPTAANTTFSCGTALNTNCTLTLTVGLNGTGADGGTVGQVCGGVANTTISETIHCENGGITLPNCPTGQTQCGTTASDCENLSNGSGPNGNCGACGAPACTGGNVCVGGVCTTPPATACTSAPCAASGPGSLKCTLGNNASSGVCTSMEAAFVNFDKSESCYSCMAGGGCFDAPHQPLVDCSDFTTTFTNGAGTVLSAAQAQAECLSTVNCILGSGTGTAGGTCASNGAGVSWCYCAEAATTCAAADPTTLTGACTGTELAGFAYTTGGSTPVSQQVLSAQTNPLEPAGAATNALACASLNGCTSCF